MVNPSLLVISRPTKRLGRFHDLLILAVMHAGQNVSAVVWPRCCHTMQPQGNVMGGQVWPQWKSFSCHVSHIYCRGNVYMYGSSGWKCVRDECHKRCLLGGLYFTTKDRTKCWDYFITWHLRDTSLTTWRRPRYHFPLLDPFVNISVYFWCGGVNIKFSFQYKQVWSATKEVQQTYTKTLCLCLAETVTCPHQVDLTNLCLRAVVQSVFLSKNNGSNNNSEVKVAQILCTVTKSAAGSIWRPPLSPGWNRLKLTHTHKRIHTQTHRSPFYKLHILSCW